MSVADRVRGVLAMAWRYMLAFAFTGAILSRVAPLVDLSSTHVVKDLLCFTLCTRAAVDGDQTAATSCI